MMELVEIQKESINSGKTVNSLILGYSLNMSIQDFGTHTRELVSKGTIHQDGRDAYFDMKIMDDTARAILNVHFYKEKLQSLTLTIPVSPSSNISPMAVIDELNDTFKDADYYYVKRSPQKTINYLIDGNLQINVAYVSESEIKVEFIDVPSAFEEKMP